MPTDDELRAIAAGTGYLSGGMKALRAVYEAGREDAAREYQTRGEYEIGHEHGVLAGVAAERERCARIAEEVDRQAEADLGVEYDGHAAEVAVRIRADREPEPEREASADWAAGFEAGAGRKPRFGEVKNRRRYDDEPEPATATCPKCGVTVTDQTPSGFYLDHDERCGGPLEEPEPATEASNRELIERAVADLTPMLANETQAWNVWNCLNTSGAFIEAFRRFHPAPATEEGSNRP